MKVEVNVFSFAAGSLEGGYLLLQDCFKRGLSQSGVIAGTAADAPFTYFFPYRWPDCELLSDIQNMMLWLILELFSKNRDKRIVLIIMQNRR